MDTQNSKDDKDVELNHSKVMQEYGSEDYEEEIEGVG